MTERKLPMNTRDRLLRGEIVIAILGPLKLPERESFVRALRTIASAGPHTRVGLGFHADGRNWVFDRSQLDQWCDDLVLTVRTATAETVHAVAMQQTWLVDAEHPLRFVLAGDYIIQVNDHSIGDGATLLDRLSTVVKLACGDDDIPAWVTNPPRTLPLVRALENSFVRNRGGVRALLANRKADRAQPRVRDTGELIPWRPELAASVAASPPSALKSIQRWIRETDRSVTVAGALVVLLRRAFETSGMEVQRDTTMVYNLRRYLPEDGGALTGNLISGLPLRVDDGNNPKQVSDAIARQLDSGRPLVALVIGVVRRAIFGGDFVLAGQVHAVPRVQLVFNNMGVARALQQLPWTTAVDERTVSFVVRPDEPEDITVIVAIVGGVIHLTASFHANVFSEAAVTEVLQRALDNPLALLESLAGA